MTCLFSSFNPVKYITAGEGGAVLTNDFDLASKVRLYHSHGMVKNSETIKQGAWYYDMVKLGFDYRISDLQCALGVSQIKRLNSFKIKRQEIVQKYNNSFKKNPKIITPPWPENTSPCFHLYIVQFSDGEKKRNLWIAFKK